MSTQHEKIWPRLLQAGLVNGDAPEAAADGRTTPWYVKMMLGFSGWLAALFLIGFVGLTMESILQERPAAFVIGAGMIFGAYAILKEQPEDFLEHMGLAVSLCGLMLVSYSFLSTDHPGFSSLGVMIVSIALSIYMPNVIHRFFTTFLALLALKVLLLVNHAYPLYGGTGLLALIWLWHNEFRYPQKIKEMHSVSYGALIALIFFMETITRLPEMLANPDMWQIDPWTGELLLAGVIFYGVFSLMPVRTVKPGINTGTALIAGGVLLALLSLKLPLLSIGVLAVLFGFKSGNRILMGIGAAGVLYAFATYYFQQAPTLMEKSVILLIAGAVLLGMRFAMKIFLADRKEAEHA